MAYPQPNADSYATKGYDFFRLNTPLVSPGDIYESQQGAVAFALGPESDVANVRINYYDDQVSTFLQQTSISNLRPFAGKIAARNSDAYMPAQRPGRILISPSDLYDPSYVPSSFVPADQLIQFPPQLDVIQYFNNNAPAVSPSRIDKEYRLQNIPGTSRAFFVVPFWGRRFAQITLLNNTGNPINLNVAGVDYFVNQPVSGVTKAAEQPTAFITALADATIGQIIMTADSVSFSTGSGSAQGAITGGMFDAVLVKTTATPGGTFTLIVRVSDND